MIAGDFLLILSIACFYQFLYPRHFIRAQCRTAIAVYLDQLGIGILGIRGGELLFLQGVRGGALLFLQGVRGGALLFLKGIRGDAVLLSLSLKCNLLRLSFSYIIFGSFYERELTGNFGLI
jgi:hypothetical protein